jgi:hypothetical protein
MTELHVPSTASLWLPFVVLYIGPDQILPLTSVLGGIVGVLLMFWQRLVNAGRRMLAFRTKKSPAAPKS